MEIRLIQRFCCWCHSARSVLILLVVFASFGGPVTGRALDDAAELPTATATETIPAPPEVVEVEAITPTAEPSAETSTPTEEPTLTPSAIPTEGSEPATEEPSDTEQPEATTEPDPGVLRFAPDLQPECKPAPGTTDEVALGGTVDYVCTAEIEITGERFDPAMVRVDWWIKAVPGAGWQVQLLAPPTETDATPRWTGHSGDPIELRGRALLTSDVTQADAEAFVVTERLQFGLRLQRSGCGSGGEPVKLAIEIVAGLPNQAGISVERLSPQPQPFPVRPVLLPTVEPELSFGGGLNFGEVPVDALGVQQQPAPQTITLTVSGLDQACDDWSLGLVAEALTSVEGENPTATLNLVSINDAEIPDGGCVLDGGCEIAVILAGPDIGPVVTYTLGVSLVLPDQLHATTFNSTLTATLAEATPS